MISMGEIRKMNRRSVGFSGSKPWVPNIQYVEGLVGYTTTHYHTNRYLVVASYRYSVVPHVNTLGKNVRLIFPINE